MSKKSRRRNKRLAALAGLLGGAMLLGRGRGKAQGVSGADKSLFTSNAAYSGSENMPKGIDKTVTNVTNPNVNLSRMTGAGPNKGEIGQGIRANYARKMRNIAADRNRNDMLRSIRSNVDIATTPDSILQGVPLDDYMISAKKGGRIVKGEKVAKLKKKKSIQIRGFGKARRG